MSSHTHKEAVPYNAPAGRPALRIAFASGKGGTGKTTVATNLALVAAAAGEEVTYLDCDVEVPDGHLFIKPEMMSRREVTAGIPRLDMALCDVCGKCGEFCRYSAITVIGKKVLTFPGLCHHCGGCMLVCPVGAISEKAQPIGSVEEGAGRGVRFVQGLLKVGALAAPPVISAVKEAAADGLVILDAPPGTSCPVIETLRDSDFVVLVTEPTPFGLNDLAIAVEMLRMMSLPFCVLVNRARPGATQVADYCADKSIDIIAEIPDDRRIAESYSRGEMIIETVNGVRVIFEGLFERLCDVAGAARRGTRGRHIEGAP